MGLWLLQECQRAWALEQRELDYDTLLAETDSVPAHATLIDPDDPRFLAPERMPDAINSYLRERGQPPLRTPAEYALCIMESLVLRYGEVLRQLEKLTEMSVHSVHVLGGGSRNTRLNQWLANASGLPVIAGPVEATALADIRAIAQRAPTQVFAPRAGQRAAWDEAAGRFAALTAARPL